MSSTTNTDSDGRNVGEEFQTACLTALLLETSTKKHAIMKKAADELNARSEALRELGERMHRIPVKLIASRWGTYADAGAMVQIRGGERVLLQVYHPLNTNFFGHSPKDEWETQWEKLRPTPLVDIVATRLGYECKTIDKPKAVTVQSTVELTTLIVDVLADYGVSVEVPEEKPE